MRVGFEVFAAVSLEMTVVCKHLLRTTPGARHSKVQVFCLHDIITECRVSLILNMDVFKNSLSFNFLNFLIYFEPVYFFKCCTFLYNK